MLRLFLAALATAWCSLAAAQVGNGPGSNPTDAVTGTCAAACASTTLVYYDTWNTGAATIFTTTTSAGAGSTLTPQFSDDNANWQPASCFAPGQNPIPLFASTNASFANVQNVCPVTGRFFRLFMTGYTSGTYTVTAYIKPFAVSAYISGIVGNYQFPYPASSAQGVAIPIQGNATGTTGAVVGTLAGIASRTTYICGFNVQAAGGTAAVGPITIAGLTGTSQVYQATSTTAGGAVAGQVFTPCIPASAVNTAITITTTADGTATAVDVNSWGFQL